MCKGFVHAALQIDCVIKIDRLYIVFYLDPGTGADGSIPHSDIMKNRNWYCSSLCICRATNNTLSQWHYSLDLVPWRVMKQNYKKVVLGRV